MVNVIAPIFTNPDGLFLQTIYHPLRLYAEHTQAVALDVHVECETYDLAPDQETERRRPQHRVADLGPFQLLDVSATRDAAGRELTLGIVNRHRDRDHHHASRWAARRSRRRAAYEVNGPDVRRRQLVRARTPSLSRSERSLQTARAWS